MRPDGCRVSPLERPTAAEVETACAAIAELHAAWRDESNPIAVSRRTESAAASPRVAGGPPRSREIPPSPARAPGTHRARLRGNLAGRARGARRLEPWEARRSTVPALSPRPAGGTRAFLWRPRDGNRGLRRDGESIIPPWTWPVCWETSRRTATTCSLAACVPTATRAVKSTVPTNSPTLLARTGALGSAINWLRRLESGDAPPVGSADVTRRLSGDFFDGLSTLHRAERSSRAAKVLCHRANTREKHADRDLTHSLHRSTVSA